MKSFTYHPTTEDENSLSQLDAPGIYNTWFCTFSSSHMSITFSCS